MQHSCYGYYSIIYQLRVVSCHVTTRFECWWCMAESGIAVCFAPIAGALVVSAVATSWLVSRARVSGTS
jgi:hypothetical protein